MGEVLRGFVQFPRDPLLRHPRQDDGLEVAGDDKPDGRIRIPLNESADDKSQIAEYLEVYRGEGIQHVALSTPDIYATVEALKERGIPFAEAPPATYYEMLDERLPGHGEDVQRMRTLGILADGSREHGGRLLQIFTTTLIGPIFFEIIQRKGDEGFGEGNFQALFDPWSATRSAAAFCGADATYCLASGNRPSGGKRMVWSKREGVVISLSPRAGSTIASAR